MNKIKMSFTKVLPFVFAFYLFLMTASNITNRLLHLVVKNSASLAWNGIEIFYYFAIMIAVAPLYIGFYKFCFERVNGRKLRILTIFDFYRSVTGFVKAVAAYALSSVAVALFEPTAEKIIMFSIFALRYENTAALLADAAVALGILVLSRLFFLTSYAYAEITASANSSDGLAAAIKKSVKRGFKFMIVLVLLEIADIFVNYLILTFYNENIYDMVRTGKAVVYATRFFNFILMMIPNFIMLWVKFTAAYMILDAPGKNQNTAAETVRSESADTVEDAPFIEPYDFCIEADERFSDEKIIETENIRGVDILAAFEEMDLAFDVVNHFGIRRKLKKMYDELAFEIGEYVTYEGGREIENDFTEEIDDRIFCVSVKISRNSDHEPFTLVIRIDLEED